MAQSGNNKSFSHFQLPLPAITVECASTEEIPMQNIQPSTSPYARREFQQRYREGRWSPISISSDEDYEDEMMDSFADHLEGLPIFFRF